MPTQVDLELVQCLPTCGARAVAAFELDGDQYLAIPQLAQLPDGSIRMNLRDSDVSMPLYRANETTGEFQLVQMLSVPGGEDAEYFSIDGRSFLATASICSGEGPYTMNIESTIFEWNEGSFIPFQRIPTVAAKKWHYFSFGGKHFLALAQGIDMRGGVREPSAKSTVFEWDGSMFQSFQFVPSQCGHNWLHFSLDGDEFLAYADHIEPSIILRWDGNIFNQFQTLDGNHGNAFSFFKDKFGTAFLAFARSTSNSLLYCWNGKSKAFQLYQELEGEGGREFCLLKTNKDTYLIQARENHHSVIYCLYAAGLEVVATFPTNGGTDVAVTLWNDHPYIVVSECLTHERFRTDTRVYRFINRDPSQDRVQGTAVYQSPETVQLYDAFKVSPGSIRRQVVAEVSRNTTPFPLLVATSHDMMLFPDNGDDPSYINYRVNNRGFKELAAVSHLGPGIASIIQLQRHGAPDAWRIQAQTIMNKTRSMMALNSARFWTEVVNVDAYRGREAAIASMIDYACKLSLRYLERMLQDPDVLTPEYLRKSYLEATDSALGATIPFNAVMIATFFLAGLDVSYRSREWLKLHEIDWKNARVLITGRVGRETSGVTFSTNAIAQGIIEASNLQLPMERLYIAPHVATPTIKEPASVDSLRQHEPGLRSICHSLSGIEELGEIMFSGYPAFKPENDRKPRIHTSTKTVSELPEIQSPNDWYSMITRMRVVLEDARQLVSGCVTDYAAEQLRIYESDLSQVVVPGLDGVDYNMATGLPGYPK